MYICIYIYVHCLCSQIAVYCMLLDTVRIFISIFLSCKPSTGVPADRILTVPVC